MLSGISYIIIINVYAEQILEQLYNKITLEFSKL